MGLLNKIKDTSVKKKTPEISILKSYCGFCGVHYDSSYDSCPFCHNDEDIHRIMESYRH